MQRISYLLLAFILWSCGSEDPVPTVMEEEETCALNENMEVLAGNIDGMPFTFKYGRIDTFPGFASFALYGTLESEDEICEVNPTTSHIIFSQEGQNTEPQELDFNVQTITLFVPEGFKNIIVSEGCVQFFEFSESTVKGAMDIKTDDDNFMVGQFEATICN